MATDTKMMSDAFSKGKHNNTSDSKVVQTIEMPEEGVPMSEFNKLMDAVNS